MNETICPFCCEPVTWNDRIFTGQPGQANWIEGTCSCGEETSWRQEDRGGQWVSCYLRDEEDGWVTHENED